MKFNDKDETTTTPRRKPPPNYFSRSTQVRVLVMVFSLMLVIMLMIEARKPENWKWIWALTKTPLPSETSSDEIDTRLHAEPVDANDPPGTVYANDRATPTSPSATTIVEQVAQVDDAEQARERIRRDGWRLILKRLDRHQRRALSQVLRHSRGGTALANEDRDLWGELYDNLDEQWQTYLTKANDAILVSGDELPADQKTMLLHTLREVEVEWTGLLSRALRAELEDRPWTELERDALSDLQTTLDGLAMAEIRDDMVWRPQEQTAWFRSFEKLQALSERDLQTQSLGQVGFVQLFRQTNEYRGQLVTISGTAEMAYEVTAPKNDLGIERYFVFWMRPADGSDSPIVAYTLELPEGFPIVNKDHTRMNEKLTLTGYFFKRWAYGATDGIRTAPLILTKRPTWEPAPPILSRERPSLSMVLIVLLAIALLAIRIALWVYRAGGSKTVATRTAPAEPTPKQFAAMAEAKIGPTITERLQQRSDLDQQQDESL